MRRRIADSLGRVEQDDKVTGAAARVRLVLLPSPGARGDDTAPGAGMPIRVAVVLERAFVRYGYGSLVGVLGYSVIDLGSPSPVLCGPSFGVRVSDLGMLGGLREAV